MNNTIQNTPKAPTLFTDGIALLILSVGMLVRVVAAAFVPPGFDEAYYGVYAQHLAWGYFDHPPAVAVSAGIGGWITGLNDALSLRFGAIVLFLGTAAFLYQITQSLYGQKAARLTVALLHITPFFLVGMGAFVIPDNVLGLCWAGCLYYVQKVRETRSDKWFIPGGVFFGFGLLAKYHAVLLPIAIGLVCLFDPSWRRYLKRPWIYVGLASGMIIFSPNIIWNYQHEWVSYVFQFGKSTNGLTISPPLFVQGLLVQMGYLFPWNMAVLVGAVVWGIRKSRPQSGWLIPFILLPVCLFTLIGATRQILPHWPMPGYLGALIVAGGWMSRWTGSKARTFAFASGALTLIILAVVVLQSVTGFLPISKKADVTLDGQGWREVVDCLAKAGYLDQPDVFLFTNKWYTGGELAYAAGRGKLVTVLNEDAPHGFAFWFDYKKLKGKDGIFVSTDRYPFQPRELYSDMFADYELILTLKTDRMGKEAQTFYIWLCRDLKGEINNPYLRRVKTSNTITMQVGRLPIHQAAFAEG